MPVGTSLAVVHMVDDSLPGGEHPKKTHFYFSYFGNTKLPGVVESVLPKSSISTTQCVEINGCSRDHR